MSAVIACYVLLAIAICTIHLCLGIWIGGVADASRHKDLLPKLDRATVQCRTRLAEIVTLANHARGLSEACARHQRELPSSIVHQAASVAKEMATLQVSMEAFHQIMGTLRLNGKPKGKGAVAARRLVASPSPSLRETVGSGLKTRLPNFRYEAWQFVAPMSGESLPTAEQFVPVQCRNLSSSGFSYFAQERPGTGSLIVALGSPPDLRFVVVEVMSGPSISVNGQLGHLIECRFVRKLLQVYQWDQEQGKIVAASVLATKS